MKSLLQEMLDNVNVRKGTSYIAENFVIKASRTHPYRKNNRSESFVVTVGKPNYEERAFIKKCKKAGEPLPVKKTQFKYWPKKK